MMEHRSGLRLKKTLHVDLWKGSRKLGTYLSNNISFGGLFVENCGSVLEEGDFLVAKITVDAFAGPQQFEMKVMVVHNSEKGAGLMCADHHLAVNRALSNTMTIAA